MKIKDLKIFINIKWFKKWNKKIKWKNKLNENINGNNKIIKTNRNWF